MTAKRKPHRIVELRTQRWKTAFLRAMGACGNVTIAANIAGVSRESAYRHRKTDKAFAEAWDDARDAACDLIEAEARRRAVDGVDEPVFYKGKPLMQGIDRSGKRVPADSPKAIKTVPVTIKRYSDLLLIFLVKAARPEKYRDRHHIAAGPSIAGSNAMGTEEMLVSLREALGLPAQSCLN